MTGAAAQIAQVAVAALGGLAFHVLGVPAAWLSGSVVAVTVWSALGFARAMPRPLLDAAMLLSGATMGAGITPEAITAIAYYPVSLLLVVASTVAITCASMLYLVHVSGWARDDAILASCPGALTTVLAVALDRKANVGAIAVVQAFRLLLLIIVLPGVIVLAGGGGDGARLPGEGQPVASALDLALVLIGGLALGMVLRRLQIAAAYLLGALVVSAALHAGAWAPGVVPPVIATGGLVLIGVFIAERFRTLEGRLWRRILPAASGSLAVSMAVAALFSGLSAIAAQVGFADALVAFAPGGLEAMMILALVLDLDPLYVGTHHLTRFLSIGFGLPVIFTWLRPRP